MTTTRVNACTETSTLAGRTVIVVPADARVGLFSRALSPLCDTAEQALRAARSTAGDALIRRSRSETRDGWQAFERRRNVGGKDRHQTRSGSRGRRIAVGAGKVFYQPAREA